MSTQLIAFDSCLGVQEIIENKKRSSDLNLLSKNTCRPLPVNHCYSLHISNRFEWFWEESIWVAWKTNFLYFIVTVWKKTRFLMVFHEFWCVTGSNSRDSLNKTILEQVITLTNLLNLEFECGINVFLTFYYEDNSRTYDLR